VPARPLKTVDAVYPTEDFAQLREATVDLAMTIGVDGRPHDIRIVRSTGGKAFEHSAVQSVEQWVFVPATQGGTPVASPYEVSYPFLVNTHNHRQNSGGASLANVHRGASTEFTAAYAQLQKTVNANDQAAAQAALARLHPQSQYEEATYGLGSYQYALHWGDPAQQASALRHAVLADNAAQDLAYSQRVEADFDPYLPDDVWKKSLLTLLDLDVRRHTYTEALDIWARLQKAGIKPEIAVKVAPVMDQIKALYARQ
jgi:TonB family protein